MPDHLKNLYLAHHGKVSDKWSIYLSTYDRIFSSYCDSSINLLEIGVQNGGSLELWAKYFTKAQYIVGCDINATCGKIQFEDPRIGLVVGDANEQKTVDAISTVSPTFDLIIDDGSHRSGDIIKTFALYFPLLTDGGVFMVEDLHCSYWQEFEGGIVDPASSMAFFKRLTDVINHEHWGTDARSRDILTHFENRYELAFDDQMLSHVHSIEFVNSLCIIHKKKPELNVLGHRVVVGDVAPVDPSSVSLNGSSVSRSNESGNPWSSLAVMPEDELERLHQSVRTKSNELDRKDEDLEKAKNNLDMLMAAKAQADHRMVEANIRIAQLTNEQAKGAENTQQTRNLVRQQRQQLDMVESDLKTLSSENESKAAEVAKLTSLIQALHRSQRETEETLSAAQARVAELLDSTSWKITAPLRWIGTQKIRVERIVELFPSLVRRAKGVQRLSRRGWQVFRQQGLRGVLDSLRTIEAQDAGRSSWVTPSTPSDRYISPEARAQAIFDEQQSELSLEEMQRQISGLRLKPRISLLMPVYKTPVKWLARAIESLQEQSYENWELCAVDDCSPTDEQRKVLEFFANIDKRVKFRFAPINGGIAAASNIALEMASGEYVALLDHDDELTPDALFWVAKTINTQPDVDFIYTDECKIDDTPAKKLFHFIFKPGWSPEILFNGMLTGHLTVYKTSVVRKLNGFRSAYDFSQDYDLALRMSKAAKKVVHLERVLYLWRSIPGSAASGGKDFARESNIAALGDFAIANAIDAKAEALPHANYLHMTLPASLTVSIVIPSDSYENLRLAIDEILSKTDFLNYQIIAVCNGLLADRMAPEYAFEKKVFFSKYDKKYNFSDKCNQGAMDASGDIVVFYNDDVFPITCDWIEKLVEYLHIPGVGGVSPKLLYKDETIQYAGMISGTPGLCGTAYNHVQRNGSDAFLSMHKYVRNVSILSGACCALKKEVFWKIGGFDPINTPDGHSDMDLSYKLLELDLRCVYTPHSVLFHIGNHSWGAKKVKYKADIFALKRWGKYLESDKFFSDSMKRVLYNDFLFKYKIFASHLDPNRSYVGPDVLFIAHELSLTGAPRMLFHAAKAVLDSGGFAVVVAPSDGPMRQELIDAGIVVILDESLGTDHFLLERFAVNFDTVVINTVAMAGVVRQLSRMNDLRIVWWLHEARTLAKFFSQLNFDLMNVELICVSKYAQGFLPAKYKSKVLYNASLSIVRELSIREKNAPFVFIMVGTVEPRKGQDIFVDAILLMPPEIRESCKFIMVGKLWELHHDYWSQVKERMAGVPQFDYVGMLPHASVLNSIHAADVLVCASRDESFSLSVVEGALMGKLPIISRNVGVSEVLKDGESCLLFDSEDPRSLSMKMQLAFHDQSKVISMGESAKEICDRNFSLKNFSKEFMNCISAQN